MINRTHLAALLLALSLTACNQTGEANVAAPANSAGNELANVALPPALPINVGTHSYRCADSSVVQIDWLELDGQPTQANLRIGDATAPTVLTRPAEGGEAYTGPDGTSLTGTKDSDSVSLTLPGGKALTCRR